MGALWNFHAIFLSSVFWLYGDVVGLVEQVLLMGWDMLFKA